MKLKTIGSQKMRDDAHFQFHALLLALILEFSVVMTKIKPIYDIYRSAYLVEDEVFKKIKKSPLTKPIANLDKKRDDAYDYMVATVKSARKHYSPEVVVASEHIEIIFKAYGDINKKSYYEQTSAVKNLVQELSSDKNKNHIALLRLRDWVDELSRINEEMSVMMNQRIDDSLEGLQLSMKSARREVDKAYQAMRKQIDLLVMLEGVATYEKFIEKTNAIISGYAVAARPKKKKGEG